MPPDPAGVVAHPRFDLHVTQGALRRVAEHHHDDGVDRIAQVRVTRHRLFDYDASQQAGHLRGRGLHRFMHAVVFQERDKCLALHAVGEENSVHTVHYIFGSVHGQLECLEPGPGRSAVVRLSAATRHRAP